ncbi:MAG: hypothetical protein V7603_786 [Micromonosporaceae bacterium]
MSRTGVAWSDDFATHQTARQPAFGDDYEFLPDEGWDSGLRVQCLRDVLSHAGEALPAVALIEDFRTAEPHQLAMFHPPAYLSERDGVAGPAGDQTAAARLAAGAVLDLGRAVWSRQLRNGYALVRPAGHHARADGSAGGCVFANGVLAAIQARRLGAGRVLMVDWDAHHGNSQQEAFWADPTVLTISVHQARAYPPGTGGTDARGAGAGRGATLNVPLPMGRGGGVYRRVFAEVIEPAADRFRPDMVLVASGLDGSYLDPSARLALHSGDYGWMTARMVDLAERHAGGRLLMTHEGGYAPHFMPICFLRILEQLSGTGSGIADPFLARWGDDFAASVPVEAERVIEECAALAAEVPDGAAVGHSGT